MLTEFEGLRKFTPVSRSHPGLVHVLHVGRDESDVQSDGVASEQLREVGDLFHLLHACRASRFGDEADCVGGCGNVGVALTVEATEDAGHGDSGLFALREKAVRSSLSPRWLVRRAQTKTSGREWCLTSYRPFVGLVLVLKSSSSGLSIAERFEVFWSKVQSLVGLCRKRHFL